ncbi:MAG TPA: hypothetical protein VJS45_01385 [Acidimicrobiia bacterium]|nr:hypothetical protein [Acidimicrobiia bacterium]
MYTVRQPKGVFTRAAAVLGLGCTVLLAASPPAPANGPFVQGSGDAVANVGRVVVRASGLPLAVTFGNSLGHYQGITARGESATLDLGVLGILLTTSASGCGGGGRPPFSPDQLPQRTVADSRAGESSASKDVAGGGPVGFGRQEASARPGAFAQANYNSTALALGELLASGEGRSGSVAELVDGKERRAQAEVRFANIDIVGGLVSLRGLRWTAEHRTGPGGLVLGAEGTFGVDTVTVAGVPLPTATPLELAAAFGTANTVIAPYGLRLEPPQVTKTTGDREVRVTPLKLVLGDGTAAKPLLGPLMSETQPAREALLEAMNRFGYGECNLGAAGGMTFTFVDIVAAALGGNGGIDLELGGVLATTEGVDYGDPFGLIEPGLPTLPSPGVPAVPARPAVPDVTVDETSQLLPPLDTGGSRPAPGNAAPSPDEVAAPAAPPTEPVAVLPATRRCESTSRGRVSGCSRGAPLPASAAALSAALLLFGADWWRTRRRMEVHA